MTREYQAARRAGLRYGSGSEPGIRRIARGRQFVYFDARGRRVSARTFRRILRLVIPPAWTDVWISPDPRAHLQATGRDARGRKQYRYHLQWRAVRDAAKYDRLRHFGRALPHIRRRGAADLRSRPMSRPWILATIVRVLERTVIRIGNDEYRRTNGSYGLTTLRDRHVSVQGSRVTLRFRAKSGVYQVVEFTDAAIAHRLRRCQELPGQALFQYWDGDGRRHSVGSHDVNQYLREAAAAEFTAKDFRTWAGTIAAAQALDRYAIPTSAAAAKRSTVRAIDEVARRLGNTRAVCRRCYIHPLVFDHYLAGTTLSTVRRTGGSSVGLSADERALLTLLSRPVRAHGALERRPRLHVPAA
jgi:DNA topoisomerase-1